MGTDTLSAELFWQNFQRLYPEGVTLIAVSKTQTPERVRLIAQLGLKHFGENYVQEALDKQEALADLNLVWHFIGPIQSNKTRQIASHFDWVHSVDRLKLAERLSAQRPETAPPLNVLIQVNVSGEESKSGVEASELLPLVTAVIKLPRLRLRGLMAIPEPSPDQALLRSRFQRLRVLKDQLNDELSLSLDTLSMGMSADYPLAIEEGATHVRIGSALFGARPAKPS